MDEVAGRGATSYSSQSVLHGNSIQCDECTESGKVVFVAGFCHTCDHFLCKSCIDQHNKFRSSENHKIIEGKIIQKQTPDTSDEEKCTVHPDRAIEAYCADDDIFGCASCILVGHRSCQNVGLLVDLSSGVETSKEFQDIQKEAVRYKTLEDDYKQAITKYLSMNDDCYTKTLEGFQEFRSEILRIVEEIGKKVHEEVEIMKEGNERQLKALSEEIDIYSKEVKQCMMKIDDRKDRHEEEQLFIALKKKAGV